MKKAINRVMSIVLVILITVLSIPLNSSMVSSAITTRKVSLGTIEIGPSDAGKEVYFDVKVSDLWTGALAPNLTSCEMLINYDSNLTYDSRQNGLMMLTCKDTSSKSTLKISAYSTSPINEDGTLFSIGFYLPETLGDQESYDLSILYCMLLDSDDNEIETSISDGVIKYNEEKDVVTTAAQQDEPIEIAIESPVISAQMAGESVSVPITISENVGFSSTMLTIEYDSRLTFDTLDDGIVSGAMIVNNDETVNGYKTLAITSATATSQKKNGILYTMNFIIPEDVQANDSYCINITQSMLTTLDGSEPKYVRTSGEISVSGNNIDVPIVTSATTADIVTTTTTTTTNNVVVKTSETRLDKDSLTVATVVVYKEDGKKKVDVPVYIENNSGFQSVTVIFNYDSRLSFDTSDFKLSSDIAGVPIAFEDESTSTITVLATLNSNVKFDGNIFWMTFTLPDDAQVGDFYPIGITQVPTWKRVLERGDEGYSAGTNITEDINVTTYDGGISIENKPETTAPEETQTTETTTAEPEKAYDEDDGIEIQPLTINSKNILSIPPVHATVDDAGKQITVPLYISKNEGFAAVGVNVSFDSRLSITEDDVEQTDYVNGTLIPILNEQESYISIVNASTQDTIGDIQICTMTFTLPDDLKVGDQFPIAIKSVDQWSRLMTSSDEGYVEGAVDFVGLSVSAINGYIKIDGDVETAQQENQAVSEDTGITVVTPSTLLLGDANLDGKVNQKDAVLVLQEYAKKIVNSKYKENLKENADVNFDGIYNSADAVFILQYYAQTLAGYKYKMEVFMEAKGFTKNK